MPYIAVPNSAFFLFMQQPKYELLAGFDTIVIQRACLEQQMTFIKICRQLGLRIIYDLDDDIWDIEKTNPAYGVLKKVQDGFAACIVMSDVVTVSTKHLQRVV